jgi:mRNA interferase RelE/StbE
MKTSGNDYSVDFLPESISDLKKLDKMIAQRILDKIKWLCENFHDITPLKLNSDLKGLYKLRIGDWRVIYSVDQKSKLITIHMVGHRSEVYK